MKLIQLLEGATPTAKIRAALMDLLMSSPVASTLIDGVLTMLDNNLGQLDDILADVRTSRESGLSEAVIRAKVEAKLQAILEDIKE